MNTLELQNQKVTQMEDQNFSSLKNLIMYPVQSILSFGENTLPEPNLYNASLGTLSKGTLPFIEGKIPHIAPLYDILVHQDKFISLQKWVGTVIEVGEHSFFAQLVDLTGGGNDEEAEFPLEEVSKDDLDLITRGAIFYWNIGYHDKVSGQRIRSSLIRFRRLPIWSKEEINKARDEAERIRESLGWE